MIEKLHKIFLFRYSLWSRPLAIIRARGTIFRSQFMVVRHVRLFILPFLKLRNCCPRRQANVGPRTPPGTGFSLSPPKVKITVSQDWLYNFSN